MTQTQRRVRIESMGATTGGAVDCVAFDSSASVLAISADDGVATCSTEDGALLSSHTTRSTRERGSASVGFSPDDSVLVVEHRGELFTLACADGKIDAEQVALRHEFARSDKRNWWGFSACGRWLAAYRQGGQLVVWDVETWKRALDGPLTDADAVRFTDDDPSALVLLSSADWSSEDNYEWCDSVRAAIRVAGEDAPEQLFVSNSQLAKAQTAHERLTVMGPWFESAPSISAWTTASGAVAWERRNGVERELRLGSIASGVSAWQPIAADIERRAVLWCGWRGAVCNGEYAGVTLVLQDLTSGSVSAAVDAALAEQLASEPLRCIAVSSDGLRIARGDGRGVTVDALSVRIGAQKNARPRRWRVA